MKVLARLIAGVVPVLALTACGTTSRFVEQPPVAVIGGPEADVRQAVQAFFGGLTPPYTVKLCEADTASKECNADSGGLTATGRGGILLPLTLHVTGMLVSKQSSTTDGWAIDASVVAKVDRISPLCGTVTGKIATRDNGTAYLRISNFYCNWMLIGNVLVNADLSIDSLDVKEKVATGYYKLTFHGTGNAAGSGYYKAVVLQQGAEKIS